LFQRRRKRKKEKEKERKRKKEREKKNSGGNVVSIDRVLQNIINVANKTVTKR